MYSIVYLLFKHLVKTIIRNKHHIKDIFIFYVVE